LKFIDKGTSLVNLEYKSRPPLSGL